MTQLIVASCPPLSSIPLTAILRPSTPTIPLIVVSITLIFPCAPFAVAAASTRDAPREQGRPADRVPEESLGQALREHRSALRILLRADRTGKVSALHVDFTLHHRSALLHVLSASCVIRL